MSEEKNIDKLFKEQFKDFEITPPDAIWENIEAELDKDKRKRKVIPIWWKVGGIAASLLLLFTVANSLINTSNNGIDSDVVDTEKSIPNTIEGDDRNVNSLDKTTQQLITDREDHVENKENSKTQQIVTTPNVPNSSKSFAVNKEASDTVNGRDKLKSRRTNKSKQGNPVVLNTTINSINSKNTPKMNTNSAHQNVVVHSPKSNTSKQKGDDDGLYREKNESKQLVKEESIKTTTAVVSLNTSERALNTVGIDSSKLKKTAPIDNAIAQAVAEAKEDHKTVKDSINTLSKRWSLAPNMAPVYFNSLGNGSSIDPQFVDNSKEGNINVSYGLKGAYAVNNKITVRVGVNKVNLGYSTKNIMAFAASNVSTSARSLQNVNSEDDSSIYVSAKNISFENGPQALFMKEQGSLNQELGFIEVPIEIAYSVIDSKIGLSLIGGFSTLFLNSNDIYSLENSGRRTRLGEASNINDMSYSANFGIGVNYNISKQLRFNLEPTFKYQINTFNDTSGDFQPFFIGVYTGLSFKF